VYWGGKNVTSYSGEGFENEPLVYDVQANLQMSSTNPTGSFKWNPSGQAFKVYENFVNNSIKEVIGIKFYYAEGRSIEFSFVWAGHQIVYGNDMTVTVKLRSELDGLVNSIPRNVAQAHDKGVSYLDAAKKTEKQFAVDSYNMVRYEDKAKTDMQKAKLNTVYQEDQTFASTLANLAQQNGNFVFANNILQANLSVFAPYTWNPKESDVQEPSDNPKPNQRYGYLLGPGIINSVERVMEWSPPQQSNQIKSRKQTKTTPSSQKNNKTKMEENQQQVSSSSGSVIGTSQAKPNSGVSNKENPDGPTKQNLLQDEARSKLSTNVFLSPCLMGVKPCDILYVPSLESSVSSIEDWIVQSVDYQQTDGGVEVSLSAGRKFGAVGLMNEKAGEKFKQKAKLLNQGGLDSWAEYAWKTK
jgi:hypothetical protein